MKKLLDWILFAVFVAVLGFLALPAGLGGSTSFVIVDGRSMEPTYQDGDLVVARSSDRYEVGDVITYDAPVGATFRVVHRITAVTDEGYLTQGDNRDEPDHWIVPFDAVHGVSLLHVPHGGTVATALRHPPVLIALAAGWGTLALLTRREQRRADAPVDDDGEGDDGDDARDADVPVDRRARLLTGALLTGMTALGLTAGVLVANAASLTVDAGTLQIFASPPVVDVPDPDPDPAPGTVTVTWYLFNHGGNTPRRLETVVMDRVLADRYDVASRAGTYQQKRYTEVDCTGPAIKDDRPTADLTGSGTAFVVGADAWTHAVCLQHQPGERAASSITSGPPPATETPTPVVPESPEGAVPEGAVPDARPDADDTDDGETTDAEDTTDAALGSEVDA